MRFFEDRLALSVLFVSIPLLFLPKFNLINLDAGETAGLRVDDLILFVIGILLMWAHARSHQKLYTPEGWLLLITLFSFFSFLINKLLVSAGILHINAKIFYTVRLLEYFMFFYIGAIASRYFHLQRIVRLFFLWNLAIMTLQKLNWVGAITVSGYHEEVSTRVFGVASFPSEMGLILNLMFCYLIWDTSAPCKFIRMFSSPRFRFFLHSFYLYWMFALFGIFVIFTGNRISLVALSICFFCRLLQTVQWRSAASLLAIALIIPALVGGIGFVIVKSEGVYERSASLFSLKNVELIYRVGETVDITAAPEDLFSDTLSSEGVDMSWWIRIHKWLFAIKSLLINPLCYLQGLGPGFNQAALDGGILRIATEYGLIGVFLFWQFFASLYRINPQTKWMMIAFALNMIFFDAYLAYKTMSFLFFTCGYLFENRHCIPFKLETQSLTQKA